MLEGICIAVALVGLMYFAYRGWSIILIAPIFAGVAALASIFGVLPTYSELYMTRMAEYTKSYYPIFLFGAVFARLMEKGGLASSVAAKIVEVLGEKRAVLAVLLGCGALTYGGLSVFVVAFVMYPFGAVVFRKADIPKRLLPATLWVGIFSFAMVALPGTPQIQNIIPAVLMLGLITAKTSVEYKKGYFIICSFIYIIAFSIDLFSIFIIDRIIQTDERNKQLTVIATKNKLEYQSALIVKEEQEHLKRFRHDIRNINKTVKSLIEAGETDKAIQLLDESSVEAEKTSGVTLCRCNIINTVLYMKSNEAKEHGIAILSNVTESSTCKITDIDISRILLNLCDNAINAAKECDEKQIKIDIEINDKVIKINTENHYIPNKTKKPSPEHGNGTKIIKRISKKYGGEYKAEATNGIYKTQTYLRNINIE
mgnify:CR=1 FL=1